MKILFILHSFAGYLLTACSVAGSVPSPRRCGKCDSEQTWPPSPQGAYSLITTGGMEAALQEYLPEAGNRASSLSTQ